MNVSRDIYWIVFVCILLIAGVVVIQWLQADGKASTIPKSLVTTWKEDPRTSRAFTWYTEDPTIQGIVQIAKGTDAADLNAEGVSVWSAVSTVIDTGKGKQQGVHKAEVTGLESGTEYIYRVGSGEAGGWSQPAIFKTEEDDIKSFTWINVTDSQGEVESDFDYWGKVLDQAFRIFPDSRFIVHNGDLTEEPEDEAGWDYFFNKAEKWVSRIPLLPVTGNHDEINEDADRFTSHFNLPNNGAKDSNPGTTYSIDYGNAHFVFLNTESNIKGQKKWLREDLKKNTKEWTIVAIHRPAYGGNSYEKIEDWVKVFDEFGVDLVLQGHNHEYSRSFPLKNGKIVNEGQGTVYVTTNTTGPKFNEKKSDQFYQAMHFQNNKGMFAGITIQGGMLTYQAYDVEGQKLDEFTLEH
ncbi:purple acid phosphatase family protein [Paenibacillus segetis]|uniref:Metallophosphoesterase n=1 Tax=Paenibacillus segetis TaxID=1325360 RepID=A0ABQ1Y1G2_9BACL|nr:metallophosphoesterase family protein [Paenibacillus segetis]GGH09174.1 hypothetical protein GCM10008013_00120 [Paenibacillus segetis]